MGCSIHAYVERKGNNGWKYIKRVFDYRDYGLFGFLADVRNYSHVPTFRLPRGVPNDISDKVCEENEVWEDNAYFGSYFLLKELLDFDYDIIFDDMRVTRDGDGSSLAREGEWKKTTIREFLGEGYFEELKELCKYGNDEDIRIVFWFDN